MNPKITTAIVILLTQACALLAGTQRETIEKTFQMGPGGEIIVKNTNGPIVVESWSRNEVRVEVEKTAKASSHEQAKDALERLRVEFEHQANYLEIETIYPKVHSGFLGSLFGNDVELAVSYRLLVPKQARLSVSTVNGKVTIEEVDGMIRSKTTNGRIAIARSSGEVDAKATNGSIKVELLDVHQDQDMFFKTTNGSIDVTFPSDFHANIDARTTNGSVKIDFPIEIHGELSKKRVRGTINGGGGGVRLHTTNGTIHLRQGR